MEVCTIYATHDTVPFEEQSVDQAVAQIYYARALKIDPDKTIFGLVNSAPYLFCTFSCLLTYPLNRYLGRRGTIFVTCLISFASCLGQAFVGSWQQLFIARLVLGLGIGPKSATVPIYSAECAPANVRGALVMMWQVCRDSFSAPLTNRTAD
jgi:MFS family permease